MNKRKLLILPLLLTLSSCSLFDDVNFNPSIDISRIPDWYDTASFEPVPSTSSPSTSSSSSSTSSSSSVEETIVGENIRLVTFVAGCAVNFTDDDNAPYKIDEKQIMASETVKPSVSKTRQDDFVDKAKTEVLGVLKSVFANGERVVVILTIDEDSKCGQITDSAKNGAYIILNSTTLCNDKNESVLDNFFLRLPDKTGNEYFKTVCENNIESSRITLSFLTISDNFLSVNKEMDKSEIVDRNINYSQIHSANSSVIASEYEEGTGAVVGLCNDIDVNTKDKSISFKINFNENYSFGSVSKINYNVLSKYSRDIYAIKNHEIHYKNIDIFSQYSGVSFVKINGQLRTHVPTDEKRTTIKADLAYKKSLVIEQSFVGKLVVELNNFKDNFQNQECYSYYYFEKGNNNTEITINYANTITEYYDYSSETYGKTEYKLTQKKCLTQLSVSTSEEQIDNYCRTNNTKYFSGSSPLTAYVRSMDKGYLYLFFD